MKKGFNFLCGTEKMTGDHQFFMWNRKNDGGPSIFYVEQKK